MKNIISFILIIAVHLCNSLLAQSHFTLKDSLRGSLNPNRMYDVQFYDLHVSFDMLEKKIEGYNDIHFTCPMDLSGIQVDLFDQMNVSKISMGKDNLNFSRSNNTIYIPHSFKKSEIYTVRIYYEGSPIEAKNPPWDGGFSWKRDEKNRFWASVSCEGIGASLWWPNKDHLSDEPDSMHIHLTVPSDLYAVSNGQLVQRERIDGLHVTYHWSVQYPINNYNVTFYIGAYEHFQDQYLSQESTNLDLDYYVLDYNATIAREHFKQVHKVLEAFEKYMGPYPFWKDGYALVEAPYLGMEHQSAIAYGNKFQRGYLGGRIPAEFDFDFIILHETAHEYWGNSVSCTDLAEMWIHESFATYMENLFVEYFYGKSAALRYLQSSRQYIQNKLPIIGQFGVNDEPADSDQYYKGAWMLQTIRQKINNDSLWFDILKQFYKNHEYGFASTQDFVNLLEAKTGTDYSDIVNQYLKYANLPELEYKIIQKPEYSGVSFRWKSNTKKFDLPVNFQLDKKVIRLAATTDWQTVSFGRIYQLIEPIDSDILITTKLTNE